MPLARRQALQALAQAACADARLFEAEASLEETVAKLRRVRGIGDWTAHYIALRAAREPDAFPASDRGLLRAAERCAGQSISARALAERSLRWRPWRAQAAQQLWAHDAARRAAEAQPRAGRVEGSAGAPRG
jgi:AraC family transcriptional regulator of adaptative response / DNA-3-methyladenine glycosylase II